MVYKSHNYWVFEVRPSSGILKTIKHDVTGSGILSSLGWEGKEHLLYWVP
jgi:hypothetical protein